LVKGASKGEGLGNKFWQILENVMRWPMSQDALMMKT